MDSKTFIGALYEAAISYSADAVEAQEELGYKLHLDFFYVCAKEPFNRIADCSFWYYNPERQALCVTTSEVYQRFYQSWQGQPHCPVEFLGRLSASELGQFINSHPEGLEVMFDTPLQGRMFYLYGGPMLFVNGLGRGEISVYGNPQDGMLGHLLSWGMSAHDVMQDAYFTGEWSWHDCTAYHAQLLDARRNLRLKFAMKRHKEAEKKAKANAAAARQAASARRGSAAA